MTRESLRIAVAVMMILSGCAIALAEDDLAWPKIIEKAEAKIVIYQPQVEDLEEQAADQGAAPELRPRRDPLDDP